MSRPIYEPSLTRQDASQAWASRQLFRRPSPGAVKPVPWIRRMLTSDEEIATGVNDELIIWDTTDNNDPDYFEEYSSTELRVWVDGLYEVTAELVWDANKVEASIVTLNSSSPVGFFWNKGWWDEQNRGHNIEHNQTFTYQRRMLANTRLRLYVVHFAGVARSILGHANEAYTYMEVRYLGSWTGNPPGD